jgi:hypothetical protein
MQVRISKEKGEFPYKAEYIGYQTPPTAPAFGMWGRTGASMKEYGLLLRIVVADLRGCPEKIEPIFSEDIAVELQEATRVTLELLVQFNASRKA